jgi:glycosyltransferase involved in cell wall biosynthesis
MTSIGDLFRDVNWESIVWENDFAKKANGRERGQENPMSHYRKGVPGDWKNHFTPERTAYFKQHHGALLTQLGYERMTLGVRSWVQRFRGRSGEVMGSVGGVRSWKATDCGLSASVAVCTHNRAGFLPGLVGALREQRLDARFEIVVVDSGSTDDTPDVLARITGGDAPPVRSVRASSPGLSAARNLALEAACGDVVAFIDDDAVPRPGWLAALVAPFARPEIGCVGGRVLLRFGERVPTWLPAPLLGYLSQYDLGPEERRVTYTLPMEQYPRGANMAVRGAAAADVGGFRGIFGRSGRSLLSNEEVDFCYRLETGGWELRYTGEAVVDHLVLPERLRPDWFLQRVSAQGASDALFQLTNRGLRRAVGRLRWHYAGRLLRSPYRPNGVPDAARLFAECERREAWSYVRGLLRGLPLLLRSPATW